MFIDAIDQAVSLDDNFAKTGTPAGILHGIPISLKDQFNVKGYDTTLGYIARAFRPATTDSVLVEMLQSLGAIIIAKTNLPQSIMWCETENPLWGLTTHPSNDKLTPGGSSGGEGALLALQGSILGFGTDIGGSVRIPSGLCGIYGLKPSVRAPPLTAVKPQQLTAISPVDSLTTVSRSPPTAKSTSPLSSGPWRAPSAV